MISLKNYFNIFYLFLCVIWQPLQLYILHVDGAGRTIFALSIVALLWNFLSFWHQSHVLRSPAFLCWFALVLFSIGNSILKGYVSEWGALAFFQANYIAPFVFLFVLIIELDYDFDRSLQVVFVALVVYILLGMRHLSVGDDERMMAEGMGNLLPLHATGLVFVSGLLYSRQRLSVIFFWSVVGLAIVLSVLSGTRKALGAIIILLVGFILHSDSEEKRSLMDYFRIAFFFAVLYLGMGYVMDNTVIGERFAETSEQSTVVFTDDESTNLFLNTILGDRAIMYELGFMVFLKSPLTGIGLNNFMSATGYPYRLHTEYMVQLCENGIIGLSLLMLFYYLLIKKIIECHKKYCENITFMMFGVLAILFLNLTAWTYCTIYGMVFYGILIAFAYTDESFVDDEDIEDISELEDNEDYIRNYIDYENSDTSSRRII